MENAKKYIIVELILGLFIQLPIWFYLIYKILEYINASELMWFLYWVYLPTSILNHIIAKIISGD